MASTSHILSIRSSSGEGHETILSLRGDIDAASAPQLRDKIFGAAASSEDHTVVIDLREVEFMDPPGIGTLLHCDRVLTEGDTRMILRSPQRHVRELFDRVGVSTRFNIVD